MSNAAIENKNEFESMLRSHPQWIGLSDTDYHSGPGIGSSMIRTAMTSMEHFYTRHVLNVQEPETKPLHIGKLCHLAILEGPKFRERFVVEPVFEGRTKSGELTTNPNCAEVKMKKKAWYSDLSPESVVVTEDERLMIIGMVEAILRHPVASGLLTDGKPEISGYAVDDESGMLMKIRPDFLRSDGIIVDYKTTKDASPRWWPRDAAKLGYHVQAGYYRHVANLINNTPFENKFAFIAQEKEPPYAVTVHVPDTAFMERGQEVAMFYLRKIAACMKSNIWPGYCDSALALSLPEWALKDDEEVLV